MKDRDVVKRVGSMFGTGVLEIPRSGRRTMYGTRIKGSRAALLMRDLAPAMGQRRGRAIRIVLGRYSGPRRKLDFAAAELVRALRVRGVSVSQLARDFNVARSTIRQILNGTIYAAPVAAPWRLHGVDATEISEGSLPFSHCEMHWLAGWLEGEGSFVAPPPSDPSRPRISGETCDADVAGEVGRLLEVTPLFRHGKRERSKGWSPSWKLLRRGRSAVQLMEALYPLMGSRRRSQIESALAAVR
jgi:transcriptional regulator with XRE-family HTH domain